MENYEDTRKFIRRQIKKTRRGIINDAKDLYTKKEYEKAYAVIQNYHGYETNLEAMNLMGNIQNKLDLQDEAIHTFLVADDFCESNNASVKYSIGLLYFHKGNFLKASNYFGDAVNYNTENIHYKFCLAKTYDKLLEELKISQHHYLKTEKSNRSEFNNTDRDLPEDLYKAAGFNSQIKEYRERAKELYIEIISIDPKFIKAHINLALLDATVDNYDASLDNLTKAKVLNPNNYKTYFNIGNVHMRDQNFKAACEFFKKALEFCPKNLKILTPYMIALTKLEQYSELEGICKRVLKIDRCDPLALALMTRSLKENENFKELESVLTKINEKLERIEKRNKEFTKQEIAKTVHKLKKKIKSKLKEIKNRNKIFVSNLQQPPSDLSKPQDLSSPEITLKLRNTTSKGRGNKSDIDKLTSNDPKDLLELIKSDKNNVDAMFNLALLYYKRREYKNVEEYLLKIIEINPEYKKRFVNEKLGDVQFKVIKNYANALKYYLNSVTSDPNPILLVKIGRCYEKENDLNKALQYYTESIETNSSFLWGIFHLGLIYSKLGNETDALNYLRKAYDIDKDNTDVIAKYADELIKSKNEEDIDYCIEILRKAKSNYTGNVDIMFCLAKAFEKKGNVKEAIIILEEANSYSDFYSNPNRLFLLALLYEKDKNFNKATQFYKNILAINKEHIQSIVHLGFILHNAREYKRAHKYFKYALKIDPKLSYAHFGIGKIYQAMRCFDESINHFNQCIEHEPSHYKAYFHLGIIYLDLTTFEKAKEKFEKCLELKKDFILGIVGLGDVYYELGAFDKAEMYHQQAYMLSNESSIQAIISLANTLAAIKKYDESINLYLKAIKFDPEISDVHYFLGNVYYLTDNLEEAINHYVKSIKIEKDSKPEAYYALGNVLSTKNRHKEAVKCYKMAIKFDTSNPEVYFNLGNAYQVLGSYKKACNNYEECIRKNFSNGDVKFSLARAYFSMNNFDGFRKSEEILKFLHSNDSQNTKIMYYLALIKEKMNMTGEAIDLYKKILEIDPNYMDAKMNLQSLED